MKIIELDLERDQKLEILSNYLKSKKIKVGEEEFQLKIHSYSDFTQLVYASFLIFLAVYFFTERTKKATVNNSNSTQPDDSGKDYYQFYFKNNDVKKLESKIEKDFNVDIELEKKNPLDDVFGIWKNESVSLEKIRTKAWRRTK